MFKLSNICLKYVRHMLKSFVKLRTEYVKLIVLNFFQWLCKTQYSLFKVIVTCFLISFILMNSDFFCCCCFSFHFFWWKVVLSSLHCLDYWALSLLINHLNILQRLTWSPGKNWLKRSFFNMVLHFDTHCSRCSFIKANKQKNMENLD